MLKSSNHHPYKDFLVKNKRICAVADEVLYSIGKYSDLRTADDFEVAVDTIQQGEVEKRKSQKKSQIMAERYFGKTKINKFLIRKIALAGRAAEVVLGYGPWHHQIVCATYIMLGYIIDMPNGSGKTLAAAMAAAAHCLSEKQVHIATANDYLAERDLCWMGQLYTLLGLTGGVLFTTQSLDYMCGVLNSDGKTLRMAPKDGSRLPSGVDVFSEDESPADLPRVPSGTPDNEVCHKTTANYKIDDELTIHGVFQCNIIYGKIDTFGFSYLRDNLKYHLGQQVNTRRVVLIVDECDTVLIDDLGTPITLTQKRFDHRTYNNLAGLNYMDRFANQLIENQDYIIAGNDIQITFDGVEQIRNLTGHDFFSEENCGAAHTLLNSLKANKLYTRDEDYAIQNNEIIIIDQLSGRFLFGAKYNAGLHEAIAVKEGLPVSEDEVETVLIGRITIKNLVLTYGLVSGISGAIGSIQDYQEFYGLDSVKIPPYPPSRVDYPDLICMTKREAVREAVALAIDVSKEGQPVLLNVPSLKDVDIIAAILKEAQATYQALDAREVKTLGQEAEKIKLAASPGQITVCSKIAARGTDITMGPDALEVGGLYVIGLERSEERRYDQQLRGRAGRHGEPGNSRFVLSLEDDLLKIFGGDRIKRIFEGLGLGMEDGEPVESDIVTRAIRKAQKKVQMHNHLIRISVVERDDILARHRVVFYDLRQKLLAKNNLIDDIMIMVDNWVQYKSRTSMANLQYQLPSVHKSNYVLGNLQPFFDSVEVDGILQITNDKRRAKALNDLLRMRIQKIMDTIEHNNDLLKSILLETLDDQWSNYLQFEIAIRDEIAIYTGDTSTWVAHYAAKLEEHFDGFFYEAGEIFLKNLFEIRIRDEKLKDPTEDIDE